MEKLACGCRKCMGRLVSKSTYYRHKRQKKCQENVDSDAVEKLDHEDFTESVEKIENLTEIESEDGIENLTEIESEDEIEIVAEIESEEELMCGNDSYTELFDEAVPFLLSSAALKGDMFIKDLVDLKTNFGISKNGINAVIQLIKKVVRKVSLNANVAMQQQISCVFAEIFPFQRYEEVLNRLNTIVPLGVSKNVVENRMIYKFSLSDWLQSQVSDDIKKNQLEYGFNYFNNRNDNEIGDWWDSKCAKTIVPSFASDDLFIHITGDGFQLFRNKLHETGILDISILNYHPLHRKKNTHTFVYGVISGPVLPSNWNEILHDFVQELAILLENGFIGIDGRVRRVVPVVISGDLKFLEKIDEKLSTGTYRCCRYCNCIGVGRSGPKHRTVYYDLNTISGYRMEEFEIFDKYGNELSKNEDIFISELQEMESLYLKYKTDSKFKLEYEKKKKLIGFKRFPIIYTLKTLNPMYAITIDSMHFIGNFAKTIFLITNNDEEKGKPHHKGQMYSLSKAQWKILGMYIEKMVSPSTFGRLPRSPTNGKLKAIEWQFFLLNLFIPLLFAANVPLQFLEPLAAIIGDLRFLLDKRSSTYNSFIECQKSLIKNYLNLEKMIINFTSDNLTLAMARLDFCTSNTHLLLHLIKVVIDQGPFFIYSQWALESKLGKLRDYVFSRSKPEENLVKNIKSFIQTQSIGSCPRYCIVLLY